MPQDTPPSSKLIFISYDNSSGWNDIPEGSVPEKFDDFQFGPYLYQRLKYRGLPVRTYGVDEAIGGAGFGPNSIKVASPMIAVIEGAEPSRNVQNDIEMARNNGKEILIVLASNIELPENLREYDLFDFHNSYTSEEAFYSLFTNLSNREYPAQSRSRTPDAEANLRQARICFSEYLDASKPFRDKFYYRYYYMRVFDDLYNKQAKIEALHDFANYHIMPSLVVAALQDDPHDVVQANAAFALAKFSEYELSGYLYEATKNNYSNKKYIYANIAYVHRNNPELLLHLVDDLKWLFELTPSSTRSVETPLPANLASSEHFALPSNAQHIFISYARQDCESFAIEFATRLEALGLPIWIDTKLVPGSPLWTREIETAIKAASRMVVLLTPALHESQWCKREIGMAQDLNIPIIPILTLPTKVPLELIGVQGLRGNPILSENPEQVVTKFIEFLQQQKL